jgi:hypothetical protein
MPLPRTSNVDVPVNAKKCPSCGFECRKPSKIEHAKGELMELTSSKKYYKDEKQLWYSMLKYIQEEKGRKPGWVANQYRDKFSE